MPKEYDQDYTAQPIRAMRPCMAIPDDPYCKIKGCDNLSRRNGRCKKHALKRDQPKRQPL